ncbi:hypothetical protein [Noviherbaspirillum humi]|nr:hypothetical protein [Noviherbaspirillum humi]
MNNAQQGALVGAGAGLGAGLLASEVLCNKNDVACRNRTMAAGAVVGASVGYITGHERDLQIAEQLAVNLRGQGYTVRTETQVVEVAVPVDSRTGAEIPNAQLAGVPKEMVVNKPKKVNAIKSLTVVPKNPHDGNERMRLSRELLASAGRMSGRTQLIVAVPSNKRERQELTALAREKNAVVREDRAASGVTLAAL